jgi:hypothetical protein
MKEKLSRVEVVVVPLVLVLVSLVLTRVFLWCLD